MADNDFWLGKKVIVTGGGGFIGSYVLRNLVEKRGVSETNIVIPRSKDCDLREFQNCSRIVKGCQIVIHLAAVTGGIHFSRAYPAKQYYDSSFIDMNMVEAACREGVEKFVAIGNLFAYAGDVPMPIKEDYLFNGLPTDAHRGVGWFKRNLALLADLYYRQYNMPMVVVYSANAYGPGDTLDREHAHVIPATIMKCFYEHELIVWGDGSQTRDFLYVEDIAEGLILAAEKLAPPNYVNIGSGNEITIRDLVHSITKYSDFKGKAEFDATKSGGDARRCTDSTKAERLMGFKPVVGIEDGINETVKWYKSKLMPA